MSGESTFLTCEVKKWTTTAISRVTANKTNIDHF